MNKISIICLLAAMLLVSCGNTVADATREIDKLYPEAEIYRVDTGIYIMFDSVGVYYICNEGLFEPKFSKTLIKKY